MVDCLKDLLARQNLGPEIYLISKYEHARQTAERLSDGRPNTVYPTVKRHHRMSVLTSICAELSARLATVLFRE